MKFRLQHMHPQLRCIFTKTERYIMFIYIYYVYIYFLFIYIMCIYIIIYNFIYTYTSCCREHSLGKTLTRTLVPLMDFVLVFTLVLVSGQGRWDNQCEKLRLEILGISSNCRTQNSLRLPVYIMSLTFYDCSLCWIQGDGFRIWWPQMSCTVRQFHLYRFHTTWCLDSNLGRMYLCAASHLSEWRIGKNRCSAYFWIFGLSKKWNWKNKQNI